MRLIDADALTKQLEEMADNEWNKSVGSSKGLEDAIDVVESMPTIKTFTLADIEEQYRKGLEKGLEERLHGEWVSCSERLPEENICDDGYVEPSDYVLVFGDHGEYGVSRYWGNRKTKKDNPDSFSDWMDLKWCIQKPIAWMPLPEPYKKEGDTE